MTVSLGVTIVRSFETMCGIGTIVVRQRDGIEAIHRALSAASMTLYPRGPQGAGLWYDTVDDSTSVGMVTARLAVMNPDIAVNQPCCYDDVTVVFNGEIYNHRDLVTALNHDHGHRLSLSCSEASLIACAWRSWGQDMWRRLRGMWAIALWDSLTNQCVLSRDYYGEKPLYWQQSGQSLVVASHVRAMNVMRLRLRDPQLLAPRINPVAMMRYWGWGYRYSMSRDQGGLASFLDHVAAVPCGTTLTFNTALLGSDPSVYQWAQPLKTTAKPQYMWGNQKQKLDDAFDHAVVKIRDTLDKSVMQSIHADVPVVLRLSGGIDSGILGGIMKDHGIPICAYAMALDDQHYGEGERIQQQAQHIGANIRWVDPPCGVDLRGHMKHLASIAEAPLMTITTVLNTAIARAVCDDGMKVTLAGTGADEIFSGYMDHPLYFLSDLARYQNSHLNQERDFWHTVMSPVIRNQQWHWRDDRSMERGDVSGDYSRYARWELPTAGVLLDAVHSQWQPQQQKAEQEIGHVAHDCIQDGSNAWFAVRRLCEMRDETLPVLLHQDDLAFMAYSVENRAPFLDPALAQLVWNLPHNFLIRHGYPKALLRAASKTWLSPPLRYAHKIGFNGNFHQLYPMTEHTLRDIYDNSPLEHWVDPDRLIKHHRAHGYDSGVWFSLLAGADFIAEWWDS